MENMSLSIYRGEGEINILLHVISVVAMILRSFLTLARHDFPNSIRTESKKWIYRPED